MHRRWASTAVLQGSLAARLRAASSKPKISTPKPHPRIASLARQYYSLSDAERQSLRQALTLIGKRHAVQLIRKLMALPKTNKSASSLQPTVVAPASLQKPASTEAPTLKATLPQQQSTRNASGLQKERSAAAQPIRPKTASHSPKPPLASTPKVAASQGTTPFKTESQQKKQSSFASKTAGGAAPLASGPKPKSPAGSTPTKTAKQDPLPTPPLVGVSGPKAASPSKPTKASSPNPEKLMGPTHAKTTSQTQKTSAATAPKPPGASGSTPATSTSSPSTGIPSTAKKAYFSVTDLPEDFFTSHLPKQRRVESPPEAVIKSPL